MEKINKQIINQKIIKFNKNFKVFKKIQNKKKHIKIIIALFK